MALLLCKTINVRHVLQRVRNETLTNYSCGIIKSRSHFSSVNDSLHSLLQFFISAYRIVNKRWGRKPSIKVLKWGMFHNKKCHWKEHILKNMTQWLLCIGGGERLSEVKNPPKTKIRRKRQRVITVVITVIIPATNSNLYYSVCVFISSWGKKASHEQNMFSKQ